MRSICNPKTLDIAEPSGGVIIASLNAILPVMIRRVFRHR